jgi:hypothetical protein
VLAPLVIAPDDHEAALDGGAAHAGDDVVGDLRGDLDERELVVDLDGADDAGAQIQLIGNGTDQIRGAGAELAASANLDKVVPQDLTSPH